MPVGKKKPRQYFLAMRRVFLHYISREGNSRGRKKIPPMTVFPAFIPVVLQSPQGPAVAMKR